MLERTPPHSLEAEKAVLGGILRGHLHGDNGPHEKARAVLNQGHFHDNRNRVIFAAMEKMAGRGVPIDLVTLGENLRGMGHLDAIGGRTYLSHLLNETPTAGHVRHYANIVREKANLRHVRNTALGVLDLMDGDRAHGLDGELLARATDLISKAVPAAVAEEAQPLVSFIPAAELRAPPVEFLVDGLIPAGMLTTLSGPDKVGKTLLALEVARSVLTGRPLFDVLETRQGPVLACLFDDPRSVTVERLAALGIKGHPDLFIADRETWDLTDPLAMIELAESKARTLGARLVIVDTLYLLLPQSRDALNDSVRMNPIMQALNRLAERTGAADLLIAHDRKSRDEVAGSFAIRAASKQIVRLTFPEDKGRKDETDEVDSTPRRHLIIEGKLVSKATWVLEMHGPASWKYLGKPPEVRREDVTDEVKGHLHAGGEGRVKDIAGALGRRVEDVQAALSRLVERGEAESSQVKPEGKGRPKTVYRATNLVPETNLVPDPPELKSGTQPVDIQHYREADDFSSQVPTPKREKRELKSPPLPIQDEAKGDNGPLVELDPWAE